MTFLLENRRKNGLKLWPSGDNTFPYFPSELKRLIGGRISLLGSPVQWESI